MVTRKLSIRQKQSEAPDPMIPHATVTYPDSSGELQSLTVEHENYTAMGRTQRS